MAGNTLAKVRVEEVGLVLVLAPLSANMLARVRTGGGEGEVLMQAPLSACPLVELPGADAIRSRQ